MYDPSEALLQLGLYDYVWGNPSLLQTYNANVQAEKARAEQNAYNKLWKQIEDENAKERADADKREKLTQLYKDYNNATGEQERAIIAEQIRNLKGDSALEDRMLNAYNADRAAKAQYMKDKALVRSQIPTTFANDKAIDNAIGMVMNSKLHDEDKEELVKELQNKKSTAQLVAEAKQSAIASHGGKKTTESLEEKDKKKKLADKAREKIAKHQEGRVTIAERQALDEGY